MSNPLTDLVALRLWVDEVVAGDPHPWLHQPPPPSPSLQLPMTAVASDRVFHKHHSKPPSPSPPLPSPPIASAISHPDDQRHRCPYAAPTRKALEKLPGQSLNIPLGIVHITKAGGTTIEANFDCPDIRCYGHSAYSRDWEKIGMDSLVVIREPVARFLSNFQYAKFGSEVTRGAAMKLQGKHTSEFLQFRTAGDFVDALAQTGVGANASMPTTIAWDAVTKREGGIAFRKQIRWLYNTSRSRLHVVCYDAVGIAPGVAQVIRSVGSNCSVAALNRTINRTTRPAPGHKHDASSHDASSSATLDEHSASSSADSDSSLLPNQTAWVASQYLEDVALHRALCEPHLPRLTLPHPLPSDMRWIPGIVQGHAFDPARIGTNGWAMDYRDVVSALAPRW